MTRVLGFCLKGLGVLILVLMAVGVVYEQSGRRTDRTRFAQIGRSVDIGGRSLNIHCSGDGSPVVVLEAPTGFRWTPIQRQIATFTRVCSYDRAGYGWSDPGPKPRTASAMATDLRELLRRADVPSPYVLVGASGSAYPIRVFAGRYLDDVAGVVLIDPAHEDQKEPGSMLSPANRLPNHVRSVLYTVVPLASRVGLLRFASQMTRPSTPREPPRGMSREEAHYFDFISTLPGSIATSADEARNLESTTQEARNAEKLGDRPVIVLTAGRSFVPRNPSDAAEARAFREVVKNELHPQLARLSSRGRQIIVENSGHAMQFEAPEVVVGAVREVIAVRRHN